MILTIHQPAYLPWLGYFDKIIRSDAFIYLDHVQFEKNSFTNRNKIKTSQGEQWLTIPVKLSGHMSNSLLDIEIDNTQHWQKKHLKSILANYKKAKYFNELYPKLEELYNVEYRLISDLCYNHLLFWLNQLEITTPVLRSHEMNIRSSNSQLVLDLCTSLNANTYISGTLGKNYLEEDKFREKEIKIVYQNYKHPLYPQLWGDFIQYMSVVDFMMNSNDVSLLSKGE